jgi:hypothetical protein
MRLTDNELQKLEKKPKTGVLHLFFGSFRFPETKKFQKPRFEPHEH